MGMADVVPGVSGGTMALILGIYQRLLDAIRSFDTRFVGHLLRGEFAAAIERVDLKFLIPLGIGIFAALMFFTRVVPLPLWVQTQPQLVFAFFFGLIVASILVLIRGLQKFTILDYLVLLAGVAGGWFVVTAVPVETPNDWWFIVVTGMLAISALILPGISGSFILLIMKKYAYILGAISEFNFAVIAPFALGAIISLMLFSRLLSSLLKHFYQRTLVTIIGILIGSLWIIWPFQNRTYELVRNKSRLIASQPIMPDAISSTVVLAIALSVLGFVLVLALAAFAHRKSD